MNTKCNLAVLVASLGLAVPASVLGATTNTAASIGTIDFRADCDQAVRADVDHALGMMHHMMYNQARSEFQAAARADPGCAMAHWGVATTLFQPLWGTSPGAADIALAREAIQSARETADEPREQLLIDATAAFFDADTSQVQDRLAGWIEGMAEAYQAFPEDLDVASLYALSRLTLALSSDNRSALHDEAEQVLRKAWETQPTHPGAVHYTIHATDADGRAGNATRIVAAYGAIAPNVPHALHMPSHIYVRLGDWPRVIEWNRRSADVAIDHVANGAKSFHYIHALDYLVYGHLQRGEDRAARAAWAEARDNGPHQANFPGAFHQAAIPARLVIEARDWEGAVALKPGEPNTVEWGQFPWPSGLTWFAKGLGAVHMGDLEAAREAEQRLATLVEDAQFTADKRFSTYIEVDRRILAGWIARAEEDPDKAIALMRTAGELEATAEKHPVTPGALLPPYEALGDLLVSLERPVEALVAYETSNRTWPQRYNTLEGAAHAADLAGDARAAELWTRRLRETAPGTERQSREGVNTVAGG